MLVSPTAKEEVISTLLIEMERMFTVLSGVFPADHPEHAIMLEKIEAAFLASLAQIN